MGAIVTGGLGRLIWQISYIGAPIRVAPWKPLRQTLELQKRHRVALNTVERHREIVEQTNDLPMRNPPDDWWDQIETMIFATMGNDEVGYATIACQPAIVSTRAADP